ncbi:hypothetical protein, partial [Actinomadura fibrosa]|uniref:hypothetical protein n=1 Tax=Actinomadura fibrosa TaxID=111802 RepID=UPI0010413D61
MRRGGTRGGTRALAVAVGTAAAATLAADVTMIMSGRLEGGGGPGRPRELVSVAGGTAPPPAVAPLTRRYT